MWEKSKFIIIVILLIIRCVLYSFPATSEVETHAFIEIKAKL